MELRQADKKQDYISVGCQNIDSLLGGGIKRRLITQFYGPSTVGKTNICMQCSLLLASNGVNVIFVDTESGFSFERAGQILKDPREALSRITLIEPTTFSEQKLALKNIEKAVTKETQVIVVDSISSLYRLELGEENDVVKLNREFGGQISKLMGIARKNNIAVLVSNQVYADIGSASGGVKPVSGDILRYSSNIIVELQRVDSLGKRKAIVKKHQWVPEGTTAFFRLTQNGVEDT
ncbi:MAG: DNA repair and recombination protein RadB [Candidatus Diapherotrites archaeon]|nr:DNA repair and recombination protein RadB [Candidatus Diapherotrites archaeon]